MKFKTLTVAGLALMITAGCATDDPNRNTKRGAAIGAIIGAVAGNQSDSKNGKFAGAAIGALTGAAVGGYMDRQQYKLEERLAAERASNQIRLTRIDENTLKLDVSSEATFDINSSSIRPDFRSSLDKVADVVAEYNSTAVHVVGHTDSTGTSSYNQQLSERRAGSVGGYLRMQGVDEGRLRMSGRGESSPVANNASSAGRSRNRRVEIYLKPIVEGQENDAFRPPV